MGSEEEYQELVDDIMLRVWEEAKYEMTDASSNGQLKKMIPMSALGKIIETICREYGLYYELYF